MAKGIRSKIKRKHRTEYRKKLAPYEAKRLETIVSNLKEDREKAQKDVPDVPMEELKLSDLLTPPQKEDQPKPMKLSAKPKISIFDEEMKVDSEEKKQNLIKKQKKKVANKKKSSGSRRKSR